jgi:hypothetical protein
MLAPSPSFPPLQWFHVHHDPDWSDLLYTVTSGTEGVSLCQTYRGQAMTSGSLDSTGS